MEPWPVYLQTLLLHVGGNRKPALRNSDPSFSSAQDSGPLVCIGENTTNTDCIIFKCEWQQLLDRIPYYQSQYLHQDMLTLKSAWRPWGEHGGCITHLGQLKDEHSFIEDNRKIALLLKFLLTVIFGFDSNQYNKSSSAKANNFPTPT